VPRNRLTSPSSDRLRLKQGMIRDLSVLFPVTEGELSGGAGIEDDDNDDEDDVRCREEFG
jgi:hypothetical protein